VEFLSCLQRRVFEELVGQLKQHVMAAKKVFDRIEETRGTPFTSQELFRNAGWSNAVNLEKNPTETELRALLNSCDDRAGHHVLWVGKDGEVHISRVPKDKAPSGFLEGRSDVQLRYETFLAGNGYVGPEAAQDAGWIKELFETLLTEWPKLKGQPAMALLNQF
jgi:hypothetical protein